jgi:hypothetical protein
MKIKFKLMKLPKQSSDLHGDRPMSAYAGLRSQLDDAKVLILDGGIGTQLQTMGVPMNNIAWGATALETHPTTVRMLHEKYIHPVSTSAPSTVTRPHVTILSHSDSGRKPPS